jgi:hypothetical protein
MKRLLIAALLLMSLAFGQSKHRVVPREGFVPDEKTAVRIAEAVLIPVYGETQIVGQRPFKAQLRNGVWTVKGSLPQGIDGGTALAEIRRSDGKIIRISHGK